MFFHLRKTDKIAKMLMGDFVDDSRRPLSKTDIIETITTLRNTKFGELLSSPCKSGAMRYTTKKMVTRVLALADVCSITAPAYPNFNVDTLSMNVQCSKPGSALWVELTNENLSYLSKCVVGQIKEGGIKRKRNRAQYENDNRGE